MTEHTVEIVRIEEAHIEAIGTMMARAFHFDPLAIYMIPDPEQRARSLPDHFRAFVRLEYLSGTMSLTMGRWGSKSSKRMSSQAAGFGSGLFAVPHGRIETGPP